MKILLLGEFSAFHKNLKEGLLELGHDVTLASNGDTWKNIPCDIKLGESDRSTVWGKIKHRLEPFLKLKDLSGYDIVQLVNPFVFFHKEPRLAKIFYNEIMKRNDKFFLSACGDDAYFWREGRKKLEYGPFDDALKYDYKLSEYFMETDKFFAYNQWVADRCDGIIPIMYEYEVSYASHPNLLKTIPMPVNTNDIQYEINKVEDKIVLFHGLNRYGFKGTRHVEKAFDILNEKYPDDLELIIDGKMTLKKYLEVLRNTNVVVDQTNSYSLGMNGVISMAMGKIVLGGVEPESLRSLGIQDSPALNIQPSVDSIIMQVESLLENRDMFTAMGEESRRFVEKYHDHIKVAEQYVQLWEQS